MKQFSLNYKKRPVKYSIKNYKKNIGKILLIVTNENRTLFCQEILPFDDGGPLHKTKWTIHKSYNYNRWHGIIYPIEEKPWEFIDYINKDIFIIDMNKYYPDHITWILSHLEWLE